jgi:PAS domain S-box-containing protein
MLSFLVALSALTWLARQPLAQTHLTPDQTLEYGGAVTLLLVALGAPLIPHLRRYRAKRPAVGWVPAFTGLACLSTTFVLSASLLAKERQHAQLAAVAAADSVAEQIRSKMNLLVTAIDHMAHRDERARELTEAEWRVDAENYVKDIPGITAIAMLEPSSAIRWAVPQGRNEKYVGRMVSRDESRRQTLEEAASANQTRVTPVLQLFGGDPGILVFSPVRREDSAGGFLLTILRMDGLWTALRVNDSAKGYRIEVFEGSRRLYASPGSSGADETLARVASIALPGATWTVRATPPPAGYFGNPLVLAIGLAGALVSVLLPLSIAFAHSARLRAKESEAVKEQLEAEVNERRKSEEVMRESEERFRLAFGNAPIGMALVTREGRWLRVNGSICRMLGYTETELLATTFQALTHPEDLDTDLGLFGQILAGEIDAYAIDKRYFHKCGRIVHASLHVSYIKDQTGKDQTGKDQAGEAGYFVSQIMDITDRVQMERLKSEFVATVSHELRTPLTSIAGSLGLMAGGMAGPLPPKVAQLVAIAARNSGRMVKLVNDILHIEKAAAGKLEFEMATQPLEPLVRQAIEANLQYAARYGVELELTQTCMDVWVRVDRDRLIQVLTNLLSNAAKFSPAGTTVSVGLWCASERVEVWVRDRGPGIPQDFRARIFQQFAQADNADVRSKGGTGLGLAIAKLFMERLEGDIRYETTEGEGTTFTISLPVQSLT